MAKFNPTVADCEKNIDSLKTELIGLSSYDTKISHIEGCLNYWYGKKADALKNSHDTVEELINDVQELALEAMAYQERIAEEEILYKLTNNRSNEMNIISLVSVTDHNGKSHYEVLGNISNSPKWFFNYDKAYEFALRASKIWGCRFSVNI